jgi:GDPmannose 4,6-dehydratase
MGNLEASRDWGHSYDYVRAMQLMLGHKEPDDFTIATGKAHSVRELCEYVFSKLGMDYREFVKQDPKLLRPEELKFLRGDSTKARTILGWRPKHTFETLLDEMIVYWQEYYQNQGVTKSIGLDYSDLYPNLKGIN